MVVKALGAETYSTWVLKSDRTGHLLRDAADAVHSSGILSMKDIVVNCDQILTQIVLIELSKRGGKGTFPFSPRSQRSIRGIDDRYDSNLESIACQYRLKIIAHMFGATSY